MADGDPPQLNAPPDDQISVSPIVSQGQTPTPSAATPPPATDQKEQDPSKAEDVYINKLIDVYNDHKKQDAQYMAQSQATWDQFQQKMNDIQKTPQPQLQQLPSPPDAKGKLNWGTAIGDVLSMVAIASVVFGKHGGGYKQAIQMSAVGAFVNGIQKGHEEQAKNALDQWKEQTALIQKQNQEQIQAYKDTITDKKLTLSEQMDIIKARAEVTRDSRVYQAAQSKDLTEIIKAIHDKTTAETAYRKANKDATQHFTSTYFKLPNAAAYRAEVMKRYGIDPAKSDEELQKAEEKYPLDQFNKDFKGGTVEEHEDDILGLKGDKKPSDEDTSKIFGGMGLQ
jgi:hypothetical protein